MLKWSMHLFIWDAQLTPLVAAEGSPASDWHSSVLHEYVGEEDLEVKHQAGNQVAPLSDIHCASFDVWVQDIGHHKVPALSP